MEDARRRGNSENINSPNYYATTDWNLNNIANSDCSVLKFVDTPINGINVPWLYLGMLFSTFCWHNEDNYLYSINYSHFGEVKQWYGVPGENAASFEKVSKDFYRETFIDAPDMLHHMTTQISVSGLMINKVPVYHARQEAKTFIVTFPKAFHCGFSYGFNVGEAVNFALPKWITFGKDADNRYRTSSIPRQSVFSHHRLLFTLKSYIQDIDNSAKLEILCQIRDILKEEIDARLLIESLKIPDISEYSSTAHYNDFKIIDQKAVDYDDQRMCALCKHVCVFSAIACECSASAVSCIRHFHLLCKCDKQEIKSKSSKKNRRFLISWATIETLKAELKDCQDLIVTFENIMKANIPVKSKDENQFL